MFGVWAASGGHVSFPEVCCLQGHTNLHCHQGPWCHVAWDALTKAMSEFVALLQARSVLRSRTPVTTVGSEKGLHSICCTPHWLQH